MSSDNEFRSDIVRHIMHDIFLSSPCFEYMNMLCDWFAKTKIINDKFCLENQSQIKQFIFFRDDLKILKF